MNARLIRLKSRRHNRLMTSLPTSSKAADKFIDKAKKSTKAPKKAPAPNVKEASTQMAKKEMSKLSKKHLAAER